MSASAGKTLAAEALGYETGKPLKIVNVAELQSKWVGETGKNIETLFKEAKALDCVLVFDDGEGMFGARSSTDSKYSNQVRYYCCALSSLSLSLSLSFFFFFFFLVC